MDSNNEKKDFITVENGIYLHKQVEVKNGMTYMRMKKRYLRNVDEE